MPTWRSQFFWSKQMTSRHMSWLLSRRSQNGLSIKKFKEFLRSSVQLRQENQGFGCCPSTSWNSFQSGLRECSSTWSHLTTRARRSQKLSVSVRSWSGQPFPRCWRMELTLWYFSTPKLVDPVSDLVAITNRWPSRSRRQTSTSTT